MMNPPHILGPSTSLGGNNSTLQSSVLSDGALLSHSQPAREEIKKSFAARDGIYRVVQSAEFSRPRPLPHYQMPPGIASAAASQMAASGSSVRVSFLDSKERFTNFLAVGIENSSSSSHEQNGYASLEEQNTEETTADIICFNVGKELYVYSYRGIQTETDLSRPIDKRVYKGTSPTYHIFNQETYGPRSCQLLIGFTLGQLQIIDPLEKTIPSPVSKLYNEDRYIDKSSVTCIRWLPGDANIFFASYVSGNLYVYDDRIPAVTSYGNGRTSPPPWVVDVEAEKYTTYKWKSKTNPRNPIARWRIGEGSLHQFDFSPDRKMMATVSHDGFLRIFNHHTQELLATMKSYFGGLLTVSWSFDSLLIATGGEDDLLTVYHVGEKRVICRGQAHKSWISQVKFDPYAPFLQKKTATTPSEEVRDLTSVETGPCTSSHSDPNIKSTSTTTCSQNCSNDVQDGQILYRIGSVGHDTCLCFWDITKNMMKRQNLSRHRQSTLFTPSGETLNRPEDMRETGSVPNSESQRMVSSPIPAGPQQEKQKKRRFIRKNFGFSKLSGSGNAGSGSTVSQRTNTLNGAAVTNSEGAKRIIPVLSSQISCCQETRVLGSDTCPGIREVPIIEPVMCKKVAHDRLTVLEFRKDCVVTACQEGYICTWARPSSDDINKTGLKTPTAETPESEQKPSVSAGASSYGYCSETSNGIAPSRSSSVYSNYEQQIRSPNATSPSYRVAAGSTSVYHRPTYAWQNAN